MTTAPLSSNDEELKGQKRSPDGEPGTPGVDGQPGVPLSPVDMTWLRARMVEIDDRTNRPWWRKLWRLIWKRR